MELKRQELIFHELNYLGSDVALEKKLKLLASYSSGPCERTHTQNSLTELLQGLKEMMHESPSENSVGTTGGFPERLVLVAHIPMMDAHDWVCKLSLGTMRP